VNSLGLSLVVADDHPLMRAGIKEILSADPLYDLMASAETGPECIELIQRLRPHVAIIDINISDPGPVGILREAKLNRWQTRICFLAGDVIPPEVLEIGKDGAAIFVNDRFPEDLRDRLREVAISLIGNSSPTAFRRATLVPARSSERNLTFRQSQIVTMLKLGSSNREIARVLGVSEGTIKVHLHRLFQRIGVTNRTQLAVQSIGSEDIAPGVKAGELGKI
jgi:two-component system, NarL family, nitrate/nitrite response regulator NarL